jgi:hypothetical protein
MFAVDTYLNHGDTIHLTDVLSKQVDNDGRATYFSAICEGDESDAEPHTVIKKQAKETPTNVEFPEKSVVLGFKSNRNVGGNVSIFYAVPESQYGFDVEVSE